MGKGGFKELAVWQRSKDLAVWIYKISIAGGLSKDFGLRDQMRRAAVSIASNLAEGDERDTDKDAVRFFYFVSIHKWPFSAISASICGIPCATYYMYASA